MSNQNCTLKITAVELHYCDEDGNEQSMFVNMNAVDAIAWTDQRVGPKDKDKKGCRPFPKGNKQGCGKTAAEGPPDRNLCWWTGTDWECGEA